MPLAVGSTPTTTTFVTGATPQTVTPAGLANAEMVNITNNGPGPAIVSWWDLRGIQLSAGPIAHTFERDAGIGGYHGPKLMRTRAVMRMRRASAPAILQERPVGATGFIFSPSRRLSVNERRRRLVNFGAQSPASFSQGQLRRASSDPSRPPVSIREWRRGVCIPPASSPRTSPSEASGAAVLRSGCRAGFNREVSPCGLS